MREALLDTDTLTEILERKDPQVAAHAAAYLAGHGRFTITAVACRSLTGERHERDSRSPAKKCGTWTTSGREDRAGRGGGAGP